MFAQRSALLLLVAFVGLWELTSRLEIVPSVLLGRPATILEIIATGLWDGSLVVHVWASLRALVVGYVWACAVGVPVGLLMGMDWRIKAALDPIVYLMYSAPLVAFFPLLIMWLGIGLPTVIVLAFLFAIFPVILNTMLGARLADAVLLRTAVSFGATGRDLFWKIVLPSAIPVILAGMRLAAGRAVVGVIAGEFFGADQGLGFLISNAGTKLRTNDLLSGVVLTAVLGLLVARAVGRGEVWVNRRMGRVAAA
jgi:NitT/TauT family transport system permease protein